MLAATAVRLPSSAAGLAARRRRAPRRCSGRCRLVVVAPAPPRRRRRPALLGAAGHRAGDGDRARLQRGAGIAATVRSLLASDHPIEIDRGRRRLDRRHRRHRRGPALPERARDPPAQRRQARRAQHRHRRTPAHDLHRHGRRRHRLRARRRRAGSSSPSPTRRSARSRATPRSSTGGGLLGRWQHIEYVIGFNLDRRMYDMLRVHADRARARSARSAADALLPTSAGVSDDTLAEDTDLTMALVPGRLAGRLRGARPRLDRGARDRSASCGGSATAGATAPCRRCGSTGARSSSRGAPAGSAGAACPTSLLFQVLLPLLAPVVDLFALYGLIFLDPCRPPPLVAPCSRSSCVAAVRVPARRRAAAAAVALPLQQFVYRQLMYLVVIQSVVTAVAGSRLRWHKLHRPAGCRVRWPRPRRRARCERLRPDPGHRVTRPGWRTR